MLKPYVHVVCEKVILDQQRNGTASLIGLFGKITITVAETTEIPRDAVAPKEWFIYSSWDTELEDTGKPFVLCTEVFYPDGTQFGSTQRLTVLKIDPPKRAQAIVMVQGFPIGQPGFYTVRTWVEENNERVVEPQELRIELEISSQPAPVPTSTSSS